MTTIHVTRNARGLITAHGETETGETVCHYVGTRSQGIHDTLQRFHQGASVTWDVLGATVETDEDPARRSPA